MIIYAQNNEWIMEFVENWIAYPYLRSTCQNNLQFRLFDRTISNNDKSAELIGCELRTKVITIIFEHLKLFFHRLFDYSFPFQLVSCIPPQNTEEFMILHRWKSTEKISGLQDDSDKCVGSQHPIGQAIDFIVTTNIIFSSLWNKI